MNLRCKKCNIIYRLNSARIPSSGAKVKCSKCGTIYSFKKKISAETAGPIDSPRPSVSAEFKQAYHQTTTSDNDSKQSNIIKEKTEERIDQNNLTLFEADLKKLQKSIFADHNTNETISKSKDSFTKMISSFQRLKKCITNKDKTVKELETLVEAGKIICSVLDMDKLLDLIIGMAIKFVEAERGFLMLKDAETGKLILGVAKNMGEDIIDNPNFTVNNTISSRVAIDGKTLLTTDLQSNGPFYSQPGVTDRNLLPIMCTPIMINDRVVGTILVDKGAASSTFTDKSIKFLTRFANQAAIAIENARLYANATKEINN